MRNAKVDGPHTAIVQALRELGWLVKDTHTLAGFIDCVAFKPTHGVVLFEIKADANALLTEGQQQMVADGWPLVRLNSVEDAVYFSQGRRHDKGER